MNTAQIDRAANISLFLFNGASIALLGMGYPFLAAVSGLLSEPAFAYFSWKARSWALGLLTAWWTFWWAFVAWGASLPH
jgi:hypothetical protein